MAKVLSWIFVKAVLLMCIVLIESRCRQRCSFHLVEQGFQTCPQGKECQADNRCHDKVYEDQGVCLDKLEAREVTECIFGSQNCESQEFRSRLSKNVVVVNSDECTVTTRTGDTDCRPHCNLIDCEYSYFLSDRPFTCKVFSKNCVINVTEGQTTGLFDSFSYIVC